MRLRPFLASPVLSARPGIVRRRRPPRRQRLNAAAAAPGLRAVLVGLTVSVVALAAPRASAEEVTFGQNDFEPGTQVCAGGNGSEIAGYELVVDLKPVSGTGSACVRQNPSGGNSGSWAEFTIDAVSAQTIACLLKDDAVYDPTVRRGFASVDFTEDAFLGTGDSTTTGVCVRQAGTLYIARAGFVSERTWTRKAVYGLTPDEFQRVSGPGGTLDFGPTGPPLQFGFYHARSLGRAVTGTDNWRVVTRDGCADDAGCDDADPCTADSCTAGICKRTLQNRPECTSGPPRFRISKDAGGALLGRESTPAVHADGHERGIGAARRYRDRGAGPRRHDLRRRREHGRLDVRACRGGRPVSVRRRRARARRQPGSDLRRARGRGDRPGVRHLQRSGRRPRPGPARPASRGWPGRVRSGRGERGVRELVRAKLAGNLYS